MDHTRVHGNEDAAALALFWDERARRLAGEDPLGYAAACHEGAPVYLNEFVNWAQTRAFESVLEQAQVGAGDPALDVGCGTGRWTRKLRQLGLTAIGYDVSPHMVARAREIDPEGEYRVASAKSLPTEDGSQQLCTCVTVIHHLPFHEQEMAAAEIARVLRPGGFALVVVLLDTLPSGRRCFTRSLRQWEALFSTVGLETVVHQKEEYLTPALLVGWAASAWRGVKVRVLPDTPKPGHQSRIVDRLNRAVVTWSYPVEQLFSSRLPGAPAFSVTSLYMRPRVATSASNEAGYGMQDASASATALPNSWRDAIVAGISSTLGPAPVFLIGSRAVGEAHPRSDCDVSVVIPSYKVLTAATSLQALAAALSRDFGVPVSINPVPQWLFERARHNLYVLKIRFEGVRLDKDATRVTQGGSAAKLTDGSFGGRDTPVDTDWESGSLQARRAEVSYLMSAVHTLLEGVEPSAVASGSFDIRATTALGKARTQLAQCSLLARGRYVASGTRALVMADELLPSGSTSAESFVDLRRRLLGLLGPDPVRRSGVHSAARDAQYVMLSSLKRRGRWRVLLHGRGVEGRLAAASLLLLQSLSAAEMYGYELSLVRSASLLLPIALRPALPDYEAVRDVIFSEWSSAHPLVGVIR